jgi:hypothetical protein
MHFVSVSLAACAASAWITCSSCVANNSTALCRSTLLTSAPPGPTKASISRSLMALPTAAPGLSISLRLRARLSQPQSWVVSIIATPGLPPTRTDRHSQQTIAAYQLATNPVLLACLCWAEGLKMPPFCISLHFFFNPLPLSSL